MDRIVALLSYAETLRNFMESCSADMEDTIYNRFLTVCNAINAELGIE